LGSSSEECAFIAFGLFFVVVKPSSILRSFHASYHPTLVLFDSFHEGICPKHHANWGFAELRPVGKSGWKMELQLQRIVGR
jgi:hypothetical protein